MNWYVEPWKKYADFSGRARRREYWTFALINSLIYVVLAVIGAVSAGAEHNMFTPGMLLFWIFALAAVVPSLACSVRRLHDIGKSGWWLLICFVPFVGGIILFIFALLDSTPGDNAFGPNPKAIYRVL